MTTLDAGRFHEAGFLVREGFLPADTCARLRTRIEDLVRRFEPGPALSVFTTNEQTRTSDEYFLESGDDIRFFFEEEALGEDGGLLVPKERAINKIGHALHRLDAVFTEFGHDFAGEALLGELGVRDPLLIQSMAILKPPGVGGEVDWHQDHCFLYTEPCSVIGLWFALDDARRDNGCLWVIPGAHRGPLRRRFVRRGKGTAFIELDDTPYEVARAIPLEVPRGTLVAIHGLLPHRSDANRSGAWRHAYSVHGIDRTCHYRADNWLRITSSSLPARRFPSAGPPSR